MFTYLTATSVNTPRPWRQRNRKNFPSSPLRLERSKSAYFPSTLTCLRGLRLFHQGVCWLRDVARRHGKEKWERPLLSLKICLQLGFHAGRLHVTSEILAADKQKASSSCVLGANKGVAADNIAEYVRVGSLSYENANFSHSIPTLFCLSATEFSTLTHSRGNSWIIFFLPPPAAHSEQLLLRYLISS